MTALPPGWIFLADFGIRQSIPDPNAIPANVGLAQDTLKSADGLLPYIDKQKKLIEGYLKQTKFAGPAPIEFPGAEEAYLLFVRHTPPKVETMLHVQTYARTGLWLGIVTLTAPEVRIKAVRPDYEAFVKGLLIRPSSPQS